jgi:hypothetical protein
VRSGAARHVVPPEPTSAERCGLKLQLAWQRVDARLASCLDLELVRGVSGLQGAARGPRVHLGRGCEPTGGANFSAPRSVILMFLLGSRRRAHHQRENIDDGLPGGARAKGRGALTINVKASTPGPREVPELNVRERPPST